MIRQIADRSSAPYANQQAAGHEPADNRSEPQAAPYTAPQAPAATGSGPAQPQARATLTDAIPAPAAPPGAASATVPGNASSDDDGRDDANRTKLQIPAAGAPDGNRISTSLLPYHAWASRPLPHPDTASLPVIIAGLQEIVGAEGPIHAERAYRLYILAAGGQRVGPDIRRTFHKATRQALRKGLIRQFDDGITALDQRTLHLPGKPSTLVRELGPRQLTDVPRSEIAKLVKYLRAHGIADDKIKRAVLDAYRLPQLTVKRSRYLDECLRYDTRGTAAT